MRSLKSHQRAKARGKPARSRTTVDIVGQGGLMIPGRVGQLLYDFPDFNSSRLFFWHAFVIQEEDLVRILILTMRVVSWAEKDTYKILQDQATSNLGHNPVRGPIKY